MKNKIEVKLLTLMITTRCTLRCRHCTVAIPQHKKVHFDKALLFRSIEETFKIVDYAGHIVVQGGEPFLHPDFVDIVTELSKYRRQFGYILFITNGTYIPKNDILDMLSGLDCAYTVRIDDYGIHSKEIDTLTEIFRQRRIEYELRRYNADEQYCGGWVDVLGDFRYHGYSEKELLRVYSSCLNREDCRFIWNGRIWGCGMHGSGVLLSKIPDREEDYVDLLSDEPSEVKRTKFIRLGQKPYEGCKYCNGFDPQNSRRIRAAEQIGE